MNICQVAIKQFSRTESRNTSWYRRRPWRLKSLKSVGPSVSDFRVNDHDATILENWAMFQGQQRSCVLCRSVTGIRSIMVWGGIALYNKTPLLFILGNLIHSKTLRGGSYCPTDLLRELDLTLQQDNSRLNAAHKRISHWRALMRCLGQLIHPTRLPWKTFGTMHVDKSDHMIPFWQHMLNIFYYEL